LHPEERIVRKLPARRASESARRDRAWSRRAFTLVELLVVISILGLLMALILPAVMSARMAARRTQCQNNVRNLALAMLNSVGARNRFPASGYYTLANGSAVQSHNWVVDLCGYLDRPDLAQSWDLTKPRGVPPNDELSRLQVAVLVCPVDDTLRGAGDLSYVVNGGFGFTNLVAGVADCPVGRNGAPLDLNGNGIACPADVSTDGAPGDKELYFATGLFFLESYRVPGTVRHHTLNSVTDGLTHTIMIGENARVGFDPYAAWVTWSDASADRNSFFLPHEVCVNGSCAPGAVDYARANQGETGINAGLKLAEGEAPWPNAYHMGGVHFAFVDGRVKFTSEQIDGGVYAALVSPQGSRIQGPLSQRVISDNDY
jgi:prepilin-type N-terminal cleavage/methylation domain-containing protein/prepilin-type processing-associated H-X9-DG protein